MYSVEQAGQAVSTDGASRAQGLLAQRRKNSARRPRVAVVCDLLEENWPSMDLVAEMLLRHLGEPTTTGVEAVRVRPRMIKRFGRLQFAGMARAGHNVDRVLNRFWHYPRHLRGAGDFDLFHVVDHSYAQLVHSLPPERTVVTCHDLDAFRCLIGSPVEQRSRPFRMLMGRVLEGLRKAARVTCDSDHTRDELLANGLVPPERAVVVRNGVSPVYSILVDPAADAEAQRLLVALPTDASYVLHVGSTILRKRVDLLLRVYAKVREALPHVRLVRVGGPFMDSQFRLARELGLEESIIVLPFLEERVLAAVYRRAALLLQPSEREGFGLPVVEALACGTTVLASDLAVLHEVGGTAAAYCTVGDVPAWAESAVSLLTEQLSEPERWAERRKANVAQAAKFSWAEYARQMVSIYKELL
jgi:glycosyltransferase involved in cell wall biosynthesis